MESKENVIKELDRVVSLIKTDSKDISEAEKKQMVSDTLDYFDNYVSPGWLKYRKSVSSDSEGGAVPLNGLMREPIVTALMEKSLLIVLVDLEYILVVTEIPRLWKLSRRS